MQFWISEMGEIKVFWVFYGEHMEGMSEMGQIWGFWVFHGESMEGKFCVLKYLGHVQKLFNFGHGVLIF